MHQNKHKTIHHPVLLDEVISYLRPTSGEALLDVTAGYGGHAQAVLEHTKAPKATVLVDRDQSAITQLQKIFEHTGVTILNQDFYTASMMLHEQGRTFDCIVADLGVSSPHIDNADRGFSIQSGALLDMRMDTSQEKTAKTVVNTYSEAELSRIFRTYGEEPKANLIAQKIVQSRPINTTTELAKIATRAWPGRSKQHPATRIFQAIRIEVNNELYLLENTLPVLLDLLKPEGRLAIISFHSLEDRIVKHFLHTHSAHPYEAKLRLLTKKPVTASQDELVFNPRARSAKLRAAAKIKNNIKPEEKQVTSTTERG